MVAVGSIDGLISGMSTSDVIAQLMTLERQRFCSLLANPKTQERIMGMMQTGKPVRN